MVHLFSISESLACVFALGLLHFFMAILCSVMVKGGFGYAWKGTGLSLFWGGGGGGHTISLVGCKMSASIQPLSIEAVGLFGCLFRGRWIRSELFHEEAAPVIL